MIEIGIQPDELLYSRIISIQTNLSASIVLFEMAPKTRIVDETMIKLLDRKQWEYIDRESIIARLKPE